ASREVRIVTNMRVYWDRVLVDTSAGGAHVTTTRMNPVAASLQRRGFSAETSVDGRAPFGYDYSRVRAVSPWKVPAGRYTRYGDGESYPDIPAYRDYLARYNTRVVTAPVPSLELSAALALDQHSRQ